MKDLHSDITTVVLLGAATYAADANSGWVDLQGYRAAEVVLALGVGGITFDASNKIDFKLEHADAADQSDAAVVADAGLLGITGTSGGVVKSLVAAHAAASVHRFGYRGDKRYVRLTADFSGTHGTGTPISACLIKAYGYNQPEAAQA